ncbi:hypothetical protein DMNBHIDG_00699 [Candidatus Methanoperedenaceae archaeon GB37]|nr:hypothetical protein DMNBHIDG_00699 [Candidatus Methanoperedenaceae archaeon GB37]
MNADYQDFKNKKNFLRLSAKHYVLCFLIFCIFFNISYAQESPPKAKVKLVPYVLHLFDLREGYGKD